VKIRIESYSNMGFMMKRSRVIWIAICVSICNVGVKADAIRIIGSDITSPAFYFEENRGRGELGAQFQCAVDKAGLSDALEVLPFQRARVLFDKGEVDVIFPLVQSADRDSWASPSHPVLEIEPALVTRDASINGIQDLVGKRVATSRGSAFHEILLAAGIEVLPVGLYNQGIRMVDNGHADAVILPKPMIEEDPEAHRNELFVVALDPVKIIFYVSYQRDGYGEIVSLLNKSIAQCQK